MRRLVLVAALALFAASARAELRSVVLDKPTPVPAFALEDQHGKPFDQARLQGRWTLVLMGFTHCPDVCPFTLDNLTGVLADMSTLVSPERLPQIVFLAVDPARDKPVLRDYVAHFHPDFLGVTGELKQIDLLVRALDGAVRRGKPDKHGNYEVTHSAAVAVVDPLGRLAAKIYPPFDTGPTANHLVGLARSFVQRGEDKR